MKLGLSEAGELFGHRGGNSPLEIVLSLDRGVRMPADRADPPIKALPGYGSEEGGLVHHYRGARASTGSRYADGVAPKDGQEYPSLHRNGL